MGCLGALTSARLLRALVGLCGAALLALLVNPAAPMIRAHGASPPPLAFATPTVVDPVNLYGEPDLRSDPGQPGTWYASGPWGTGTQRSIWNQSTDGTHTFRELHNNSDPLHSPQGDSICCVGGGDTEIAVDHNGKFYGADLAALTTQHTIVSTDRGKTFQTQTIPDAFKDPSVSGTDRQWFGLWDPPDPSAVQSAYHGPFPVNYMTYLEALGGSGETITSSVPNGSDSSQVGLNYACGPGATGTALCPTWSLNGDGFTFLDQLTGKVVQAMDYNSGTRGAPEQAAVEVLTPSANGYMSNNTDPVAANQPQRHIVYTLNAAGTDAIFPTIAEDAQRNAYYVWVERPRDEKIPRTARSWQVFYAWSPPGADSQWDHWSAPIQLSSAPSNTAIMPWAVAGGDGNLDVAWYGTNANPLNPEADSDSVTAGASWYLYMANVQHAAGSSPVITQVKAVDHPMHHGSICLSGTGCIFIQGNRNLADFFEISTDATGAAYIVYDNTANDLIDQAPVIETTAPEGVVDHKGAELVHVVRQVGGMGLNGTPINQPTDVGVNSISAPSGNALYDPVSGTNYPGLDITGASMVLSDTNLIGQVKVSDLTKLQDAATGIGAPFIDFVVRWEYKSQLYFAAIELPAGQNPGLGFDGMTQSVDLCSVSACDPHILTYPAPTVAPSTSHLLSVAPELETATNTIRFTIPTADVGSPKAGDHLDSVGAYSFVQNTSAFVPLTNAQAQDDQVPIEIDGACCFTPMLGTLGASTATTNPAPGPANASAGSGLPGTSAGGSLRGLLASLLALGLLAGGATLAGRRRRPTG